MILYLNNYKGFTDTFIPIRDVNFLVGENSTGKSTVLSVLEMISNTHFWTYAELSTTEFKLGPFREIVNQFSQDKTFFQIGIESDYLKTNGATAQYSFLGTYREYDGNIVLDSMKYTCEGNTIYCSSIHGKQMTIAKRHKSYMSFKEWIHSEIPHRKKIVDSPYDSYVFLPEMMKYIQDKLNIRNNVYQHFFVLGFSQFTSFSPIRAEAHRIYETFSNSYSPQGSHIPIVINRLMHSKGSENKEIVQNLYNFGKDSDLFDSITTVGFGNSSDSPFMISVNYGNVKVNLTNVGYGVSQSLPLVVELLKSRRKTLSLQQPEVHLHPKAQAAFGDLLYDSATKCQNTFFCETHSDFIINRFRYALNKGAQKVSAQVLFFTRDGKGTHVIQMPIDSFGRFENVPADYTRFFIDEELKMLEF